MKSKHIQSITYAGIFAAIYLVITLLSVFFPLIDGFILIVMPIFATYYAIKFNFKETLIFNITTLILCFVLSYSDPFFSIIYILPTLIIGDFFGYLIKRKVKFYTCFIILSIIYFLTNLLTLFLTKIIYDLDLLNLLSLDSNVISNYSLMIIYLLSIVESILCISIIYNELKKLNILIQKEKNDTLLFELLFFITFICMIIFKFLDNSIYYLLSVILFVIFIPACIYFKKHFKNQTLIFFLINLFYIFTIIPLKNFAFFPFIFYLPILCIEIAIFCKKMYNNKKQGKNIIEKG